MYVYTYVHIYIYIHMYISHYPIQVEKLDTHVGANGAQEVPEGRTRSAKFPFAPLDS